MNTFQRNRRRNPMVFAAVALAMVAGCSAPPSDTGYAGSGIPSVSATTGPSVSADPTETGQHIVVPESSPAFVSIPSIGAHSELMKLGLNADGTIEVPPTSPGAPAGWYTGSPKPGEIGPSILLGHVNATDGGPGVFADLRDITSGDEINVTGSDGSVAHFRFLKGVQYSKSDFPSEFVYGNTEGAELRLITCDGFNETTGNFDGNYVVYAELISQSVD